MNNRITTLDQVRPSDFKSATQTIRLKKEVLQFHRADLLNMVDEFARGHGAHAAINEIMHILSGYLYACSFIEELSNNDAMQATQELKEIADDTANYLPSFNDLNSIAYTLKGLFDYLLDVDASQGTSKDCEEQIQLIENITGGIPHK